MTVKERADHPGAGHHAFPRGNNKNDIFRDNADRQVFLVILRGVLDVYGWDLYAYCLMRNHVHLVIITPIGNLSDGMQRLLSAYARYFNRRHSRVDHVFRRPFKSEPIKDARQLETAIAYVAANPVKAGLCSEPGAWRWSSHGTVPDAHRAALMQSPGWKV